MARKKPAKRPAAPEKPAADTGAIVAVAALCAVLAGASLAVDTIAASAFDAPKRLIALSGTALAAAAVFARGRTAGQHFAELLREGPGTRRAALWLGLAALAGAWIATLASPRPGISLDAMRSITLLALLLPLGASRALRRGHAWLCGAFLAACGINAAVAILESRGVYSPFALQTFGARQDTGAFAGNVGYLAIALALASVLALGIALTARTRALRVLALAAVGLFAAGLLVNQNLTALTSVLAGSVVLLFLRFRARAALPVAAAVAAVALALAAYAPLRQRAGELTRAVRTGNWDALVSFRGGPWAAALEMTRERPLTGFGPGTFAAEYVPHRLAAEIRLRRRFVTPLATSSYAEAHSDYLQAFSDAGLPTGAVAIAAGACLFSAVAGT
ncbi:MAG: O-antigen ligase family protein, partial [Thermoanaerobaculia bacterium]